MPREDGSHISKPMAVSRAKIINQMISDWGGKQSVRAHIIKSNLSSGDSTMLLLTCLSLASASVVSRSMSSVVCCQLGTDCGGVRDAILVSTENLKSK